jgi:hypothetical protein
VKLSCESRFLRQIPQHVNSAMAILLARFFKPIHLGTGPLDLSTHSE